MIVIGAGPTGLMLAAELRLGGVRAVVLERDPRVDRAPKANGFNGQILQLLHYRGVLDRVEAAGAGPIHPAPRIPFGGVHLDTAQVVDAPLRALSIPQSRLERVLGDWAAELGADIRRGHELVAVSQDGTAVTVDVLGPDGPYRVSAGYLAGCDGAHSRVRTLAGIPFPGINYAEVNRLGQFAVHESVTRLGNGDLEVPGVGRVRAGFTRTDRGVFALGSLSSGVLMIQTTEDDASRFDDGAPVTRAEFEGSIRRVLGADLLLGEATRLSRYQFQARQAARYRDRRILLAGDAAHQFPATGIGINVGMLDAANLGWKLAAEIRGAAPPGLLDTYHAERHAAGARALLQTQAQVALRRGQDPAADALREVFSEVMRDEQSVRRIGAMIAGTDIRYPMPYSNDHALTGTFAPDLTLLTDLGASSLADLLHGARPVLLDLADRSDLRRIAREWQPDVEICRARTDHRAADALLIRPDAHIAWAAKVDEPTGPAMISLQEALSTWFRAPLTTAATAV